MYLFTMYLFSLILLTMIDASLLYFFESMWEVLKDYGIMYGVLVLIFLLKRTSEL
jgi:hypothetical protein